MKAILHCFGYAIEYLCEQVADVAEAEMVGQPRGVVNHPAWVIGHVAYSCQLLCGVIGVAGWLPEDWGMGFGEGSVPVADVKVYVTKEEGLAVLRDAAGRLMRAVEGLDDVQLDAVFPVEAYREVFPTVRHALMQVMVGHVAYHVGQVVIWRKAMGLARMGRAFQ